MSCMMRVIRIRILRWCRGFFFLADDRRWFSQIGADYFSRRCSRIFIADVRGFFSQIGADVSGRFSRIFSRRLARMFLADFRGFFLADWRGCFSQIFADFFSQIGADYFSITICEHQRFKHLRKSAITICEK